MSFQGSPGGSVVKYPPAMQETWVRSLGQEDPLEEEMATHSSILFLSFFLLNIYLAASGLSCSTQGLCRVARGLLSSFGVRA